MSNYATETRWIGSEMDSKNNKEILLMFFNSMQDEGTVKARWLILSCQTLMMTVPKVGQKFSPCDAASHGLTAYKDALY